VSGSERRKGVEGEQEVARVLRAFGLGCDRTVQNSGYFIRGDVSGVEGYHLEVKRQEILRLPLWLRQAEADAPEGVAPVVAFRQNRGEWYAALRLSDLARLLRESTIELPDAEREREHAERVAAELAAAGATGGAV
jgi:hypothetical protein